ncbi:SAGA histone acetyltransferase complex subunit SPT7 [Sugiyamaella lignohabitans]|uniref:SAGA complex subunit Spt7 n=1 Tax=Sugiyamaella lignohabitans TaxID=796027 RepID=A0A161HGX3_9ASCO|nr:SAGA histone acetyltransferase complex subunit SPT7 [Sugiyamaella lignohabitans]ANB15060.1 SAGA histone acetyltransferase complex subunit SPT7 [Sugiyamaella lignohabitans]
MDPSVMLRLWSSNDPQKLHILAKDIETQGTWQAYLSAQEHKIFEYAVERGGDLWAQFLQGTVQCYVEHVPSTINGMANGNFSSNSPSANGGGSGAGFSKRTNGHSSTNMNGNDDSPYTSPHFSRVSGTPQPNSGPTSFLGKSAAAASGLYHSNSRAGSAGSEHGGANTTGTGAGNVPTVTTIDGLTLAFRVRYMLYDKSLGLLFPAIGKYMPFDFDSALFEDNSKSVAEALAGSPTTAGASRTSARPVDDDYDFDDEDEDEDEQPTDKMQVDNDSQRTTNDTNNEQNQEPDEDGKLIIRVTLEDDDTDKNESKRTKEAIANFKRVYHTFENDRENLLKQRKLEESDRQVASEEAANAEAEANEARSKADGNEAGTNGKPGAVASATAGPDKIASTAQFGAANLSLKHLLATIEAKRDQNSLTDLELKNLISDVRKNRSKWASEDKIGQEELYEAAEKVVLELRGYTEHSTAFLNKVNKRDAPNYFNIIKKPMDLNTIMKKLKTFQYKSKDEFVDDLMLIWSNCFTYNTDPKHFLRAHALAMQKKTFTLIPLIPDIVVRDRAEVEAEEAAALRAANIANGNANGEESGDDSAPGTAGGLGQVSGKHATKGRKRKLDSSEEEEMKEGTGGVPPPFGSPMQVADVAGASGNAETDGNASGAGGPSTPARDSPFPSLTGAYSTPTPGPGDIDMELNESMKEESKEPVYELDVESQVWQNVYSKQRSVYCGKRSELFKDDKIQLDAEASARKSISMGKFEENLDKMFKPEEQDEDEQHPRSRLFRGSRSLLDSLETDKEQFIMEYEVAAGLPSLPDRLTRYNLFDREGDGSKDDGQDDIEDEDFRALTLEDIPPSGFMVQTGLGPKMLNNLQEIQQIRKVCSKIALIRQMQQQPYMHANQIEPYNPIEIEEQDLDLASRLPNRDHYNSEVAAVSMKKAMSKLAMHGGFEVTESTAIEALTEIAADYMGKLGKMIMAYMEDCSDRKRPLETILNIVLRENGIESLSSLDSYVHDDIERHGTKLQDLKRKLTQFTADLLRPGITELNDRQFSDNSDQFLNGDFSMELGDDFFGFRELGLDKEFGLLTSSVPFHLLHGRLSASFSNQNDQPVNTEKLQQVPEYPAMYLDHAKGQIGLLRGFFIGRLEASTSDQLPEGDQLPPKQRNTRPKLPPTGKISGPKKKPLSRVFFRPEPKPEPKPNPPVEDSTATSKPNAGPKLPQSPPTAVPATASDDMLDNMDMDASSDLGLNDESIDSLF